jgi:probable F420-dependent oxidoreductase
MDQRLRPANIAAWAQRAEALGYDGLNVPDAVHDGLLGSQIALAATTRLRVATSVLVAFPRSPMTVAIAAWDLQSLSGGRFELGLGSQVRANIIGRYSTPWTQPVPRMREYVGALRAIFDTWQNGARLDFEGESYRFTRMQPFFDPGPLPEGPPPIHLGAVGPHMTALAGEVADGLMTHPTNASPRYLREVTRVELARGEARTQGREQTPVMVSSLVAVGDTPDAVSQRREKQRELLAFLYSTPAYWPSLELCGWRERGERLRELSREGRWAEMAAVVTNEMLDAVVPAASWSEISAVLRDRYAELSDWITFPMPEDPAQDPQCRAAIDELRDGGAEARPHPFGSSRAEMPGG